MEYGLRRVTWTCLGAEQTPTGVRVARRVQNVLGFPEFTVTCMQSRKTSMPPNCIPQKSRRHSS